MKKKMKYLTMLAVALLMCYATKAQTPQNEAIVDGVAAVVGQNIIKISDIESAISKTRIQDGYEKAQQNRCKVMESYLLTKLLVHKAQVDSIEVTDEEVESQVDRYLKMFLQQYGSKEALKAASGFSYEELHDLYFDLWQERFMSMRAENELTENVKITPDDVREFYENIPKDSLEIYKYDEEYEISEIAIIPKVSEEEKERVKNELAELRERILKGERFEMLATLYSEDPGSAKKGGELGFFTRGVMTPEFEAAAFTLKPGEVSPIIETPFGYHIVQLIERRGNSINARHILMIPKVSQQDILQARMRLDSIANQVRLGNMDFAEAAKTYSMSENASMGGVVTDPYSGYNRFTKETFKELYPTLSPAGMDEGDISAAVMTKGEDNAEVYKIVRMNRRFPAHTANMNDDYDKLYEAALQAAKNKKLQDWAAKMAKVTYIRIADEYKDCEYSIDWTPNEK